MPGKLQATNKPRSIQWLVISAALIGLLGCDNSLHIEGRGDIVSLSGARDCHLEQQPCTNLVVNDYQETYTPVARESWKFVRWEGCLSEEQSAPHSCSFNVPSALVNHNWGADFPLTAIFGDTTALADLEFADEGMARCVIYDSLATYVYEVEELYCWQSISSLQGIEQLTSLRSLDIPNPDSELTDFTPLEALPHLKRLDLSNHSDLRNYLPQVELNLDWVALPADSGDLAFWLEHFPETTRIHVGTRRFGDFGWLKNIPRLAGLTLYACPADLDFLVDFPELEEFRFSWDSHCSIDYDLGPLAALSKLTDLSIGFTSNIEPLASLTNLRTLFLRADVDNLDALAGMNKLTWLNLSGSTNPDISALANLVALEQLRIFNSSISDIGPLANLQNLKLFYAMLNSISDISPLAGASNMRDLRIWDNQIVDVTPLSNMSKLLQLDLYSNQIIDVSPLAGLTSLRLLLLGYNDIGGFDVGNVDLLASMNQMVALDLSGNPALSCSELSTLEAALGDAVFAEQGNCTLP